MYAPNFPTAWDEYRLEDVRKLAGADVPSVTLATASFPCNDLSLAGSYKGLEGKHSSTIWSFVRIVREMEERRPPMVMLENVPSFLTANGGNDFYNVIRSLNELGYACDVIMVDAARFVPQSRVRLFVFGVRSDITEPTDFGCMTPDDARPQKLTDFMRSHLDLNWSIRTLPVLPNRTHVLLDILEDYPQESSIWWSKDRTDYLFGQMSERHAKRVREMMNSESYSYATAFRRIRNGKSMGEVRADGIAGCLRTPRGGSGRQILLKAGRGEFWARLLSPRECARLQGVPDSYQINVPPNQAFFGFGDAVCVPVIEWICENYLTPLATLLEVEPDTENGR